MQIRIDTAGEQDFDSTVENLHSKVKSLKRVSGLVCVLPMRMLHLASTLTCSRSASVARDTGPVGSPARLVGS